jgi:hypothetical protein
VLDFYKNQTGLNVFPKSEEEEKTDIIRKAYLKSCEKEYKELLNKLCIFRKEVEKYIRGKKGHILDNVLDYFKNRKMTFEEAMKEGIKTIFTAPHDIPEKIYTHKSTGWVAKKYKNNCELMIFRTDGSYVGSYPEILFKDSVDWLETDGKKPDLSDATFVKGKTTMPKKQARELGYLPKKTNRVFYIDDYDYNSLKNLNSMSVATLTIYKNRTVERGNIFTHKIKILFKE